MVLKRQLAEEEYDVSSKHLKLEHGCQLVPFLHFSSRDMPPESGKAEGCFSKPITVVDYRFESGKFTDLPMCIKKDVGYTLPSSLSTSSLVSSTTSENDVRSEAPILTPDYSPLKPRTLNQPEDTCSYLLKHPPLKDVPVGPEYQADIPKWHGYDTKHVSLCSSSSEAKPVGYGEDEIKFLGFCVMPMPATVCDDDSVGRGRTDCCCKNRGSLRCVQQHIGEAREILKGKIGHKRFSELGFGNMGEVVADKWTEEDELLYHEIVYSNPASFGKNFWDHLSAEFPSRTNQEIVRYYFNVFVLRRRAEQNRCDPMNIDSDDDEWQGSDGSEEDIYEYDSCNPIIGYYKDVEVQIFHDHNGSTNFSETQPKKLLDSYSFDSTFRPWEKTLVIESTGDQDFQNGSCTSSDIGDAPRTSEVKVDSSKSWGSQEFIFEPSDTKVWDVGYFSCPRTKTDFLPTDSMIEEVFGIGSWNFEVNEDVKGST